MTTFALVHGAWHGAWCWELLVPELERRGHRTVTMDLPSEDPAATFETYADVVAAALPEEPAVVVGHSLGGLTIPLVPARREVLKLAYLCALVPALGRSFAEQVGSEEGMLSSGYETGMSERDPEGRRTWIDPEAAREYMYADCSPDLARVAFERLRLQAGTPYLRPFPLDAYPAVPATYIVCGEDRLVGPDWSRRVASEWLGADLVELGGSHSPFLSRPAELADALEAAAGRT
jgi:pimeloyl-ACP methyl ester carboxylesterase